MITGDGLVTGRPPTTRYQGRRVCFGPMFNHSQLGARAALAALEQLEADLLLPGHGPAFRGPIGEAVAQARLRAGG